MDTYAAIKELRARIDALEERPVGLSDPDTEEIIADYLIVLEEVGERIEAVRAKLDAIGEEIAVMDESQEPIERKGTFSEAEDYGW